MTSPALARPGAVAGQDDEANVAAHYGEPLLEQRKLASGDALADLSHLGVITVTGPDRLSWLHSITTANLETLAPNHTVETMVLSPKGHIEFLALLVDDATTTWLVTEASQHLGLAAWLDSMRFMRRVEVNDRSEEIAVVLSRQSGAAQPVAPQAFAVLNDPWPRVLPGGTSYTTIAENDHPGLDLRQRFTLVPRDELGAALGESALAGTWAVDALRIAAWRPRQAREVDHRSLPHELDWLRTAVHLDKGCYRGQEAVARVHNLGRPPRRLTFLHLDGSGHELPPPGTEITLEGRTIGAITSSALHYEQGPIALAVVKRSIPSDAVLDVAGIAAAQEIIVGAEGVSADRPQPRPPVPRGVSKPSPSSSP